LSLLGNGRFRRLSRKSVVLLVYEYSNDGPTDVGVTAKPLSIRDCLGPSLLILTALPVTMASPADILESGVRLSAVATSGPEDGKAGSKQVVEGVVRWKRTSGMVGLLSAKPEAS